MRDRIKALFKVIFLRPKRIINNKVYDCALVCGYFANADGTPSDYMKTRVEEGVRLLKENKVKCLLLSGGAVQNEFVEAEVMRDYAMTLGVPKELILEEKKAVSTYHNMLYAKVIIGEHNLKTCVVVTNSWHLRKADYYARKFGLDYVMSVARNPAGEKKLVTWWKIIYTNVHMCGKMLQGYY